MGFFFRLCCDFEVLTPMFLGGADPKVPEVRAPSIKGAMRFWYRALDPSFARREPLIFGTGGEGARQSRLQVRCRELQGHRMLWSDARPGDFDQGKGRRTTNGLTYLGYPFGLLTGDDARRAISPQSRFSLEISGHEPPAEHRDRVGSPLRAALASTWALGHLGALGTRARRGFGAVALTAWRLEDRTGNPSEAIAEMSEAPLLANVTTAQAWETGARRALASFQRWFGRMAHREHHLHFGPSWDMVILPGSQKRTEWRSALLALGAQLQGFRQRQPPDYKLVRDYVVSKMGGGPSRIARSPDRATFGLPLTFRFGSVPGSRSVTFVSTEGNRHGSPLFLRPILAGELLHGLFLRLDGDVPAEDVKALLEGHSDALEPPATNALDAFMAEMKRRTQA